MAGSPGIICLPGLSFPVTPSSLTLVAMSPHPWTTFMGQRWLAAYDLHHCRAGPSSPNPPRDTRSPGAAHEPGLFMPPEPTADFCPCPAVPNPMRRRCGTGQTANWTRHVLAPCLPTRSQKAPSGSAWIHEIKHDGYRLIARDGRHNLVGLLTVPRQHRHFPERCIWSPAMGPSVRPAPCSLGLPRFRGQARSWDQGIWSDRILSSSLG